MRSALVKLHRWFGLVGAVWLFFLGLTGSVLVFFTELDHALNPEFFRPAGSTVVTDVDAAIRAVEASGADRRVVSFWRGEDPSDIWTFRIDGEDETPEIYLDPTTGQVTGERCWYAMTLDRAHVMPLLYQLHYSLLAGATGEWLLALVGFLWMLDHIVSAVLAFPPRQAWTKSFRIRRSGFKLTYDLHRAIGLWLLPITLIVAVSGTYMNWRPYAWALIGTMSQISPWPGSDQPERAAPLEAPPISYAAAIAASGAPNVQGAAYDAARGLYLVNAFDPRDLTADYGQAMTVVDATTGAVLSRSHLAEGTAADIIETWQLPLHSGKVAGWPGRIAVFLSGIALCSFVITGLMIWARKRRTRAHARRG